MQALTRNPLAEPGLLGVNAGAAFAVVVAISLLGLHDMASYLWFALVGAALGAAFVIVLTVRTKGPGDHARLVLAGAALTACLSSCTGILTMYDTDAFSSYRFWVVGSVASRGTEPLVVITPIMIVGFIAAFVVRPSLNVLALGDEQAQSLGARLRWARFAGLAAVTLLCGAATAAAGPIAFVGLVVPHVLRLLVGIDQRLLLVLSIIVGPSIVLTADILGRVIARPSEIEAGIVVAFLGAPVLLALLQRRRA